MGAQKRFIIIKIFCFLLTIGIQNGIIYLLKARRDAAFLINNTRRNSMKKTISILLIVAMMLASMLAVIPVSAAPKGDKISSAAEFAAMKADGEYYLANDITITASYAETFKGKLDGNGKTITVKSATPVFKKIESGKISDLNIEMEFEAEKPDADFGALAGTAYGTFEYINVDINAVFTAKATIYNIGGLIGTVNGETELDMVTVKGAIKENTPNEESDNCKIGRGGIIGAASTAVKKVSIESCANYADLTSNVIRAGVGGIIGASNDNTQLVIKNTQNYGNIIANGALKGNAHAGIAGFLGIMNANGNKDASLEIVDCRNYGNVSLSKTAKDNMVGGFAGRLYGPSKVTIKGCVNSGNITSSNAGGWDSAGGIIANIETYNFDWSTNKEADIRISNCVNTGVISGGAEQNNGGILGAALQLNSPNVEVRISNCANYAEVKGNGAGILGHMGNGEGGGKLTISGCYNSGAAKAAIVLLIVQQWSTFGTDGDIIGKTDEGGTTICTAEYPTPEITNCVNEGSVTSGMIETLSVKTYDAHPMEGKINITNCVSNGTIAPNGDKYVVTAPTDADAVTTEVKASVPGDSTQLDAILADYTGLVKDDYKAGWDAFEPLYTAAINDANKATAQTVLDAHIPALTKAIEGLELAEIDLEPLCAAITAAKAILEDEAKYTPLTWASFTSALEKAEAVMEESDAIGANLKPSDVINATAKLQNARSGLEELAATEQAELKAVIEKYSDETKYGTSKYVSASVDALKAVIDAAKPLVEDENATKSGVNATIDAIEAAVNALVAKVDPATLKAKADEISNTYKSDDYTAKTHNDLTTVIRRVKNGVELNDLSQENVDSLIQQLDDAVKKLVKKGNFDAIDAALEPFGDVFNADVLKALEYNYTIESFKAFSNVLTEVSNAKKEDKKPNFSEADAEKLLEKVNSAINGLIAFATYGDVDAKIAELNALDKNAYTAETWQALQDAIAAVSALKSDRNTTQPQADEALAAINAAVDALVAASDDSVTTDDGGDKKGCGSAIGATVVVMAATLGLGVTVVLKKKED